MPVVDTRRYSQSRWGKLWIKLGLSCDETRDERRGRGEERRDTGHKVKAGVCSVTWKVRSHRCLSCSRKFDRHMFVGDKQKSPGRPPYLGPGQARSYHPFIFYTSRIFSHLLPWNATSLISIRRPLCLLCFNVIINSNVAPSPREFPFSNKTRDEVLPFIFPTGRCTGLKRAPAPEYTYTSSIFWSRL